MIPPLPAYLLNWVMTLRCDLDTLRTHVEAGLKAARVDFEYKPASWKAKCYVYTPSTSCQFVAKLYTAAAAAAATTQSAGSSSSSESWTLELIRRSGNHGTFRTVFDRVLMHLSDAGLIEPSCTAAARAHTLRKDAQIQTDAIAAGAPHFPKSLSDDAVDPETNSVSSGVVDAPFTAAASLDSQSVADAFKSLSEMLKQPYDDVCSPAAQSICALTVSRKVRAALGQKARAALGVLFTAQQQAAAAAASAGGKVATAAPIPVDPVLSVFDGLARRAVDESGSTSIDCRTACAMAMATLSRDADCAYVLFKMSVHMGACASLEKLVTQHDAAKGALRRAKAELIRNLLEHAVTSSPHTDASSSGSASASPREWLHKIKTTPIPSALMRINQQLQAAQAATSALSSSTSAAAVVAALQQAAAAASGSTTTASSAKGMAIPSEDVQLLSLVRGCIARLQA